MLDHNKSPDIATGDPTSKLIEPRNGRHSLDGHGDNLLAVWLSTHATPWCTALEKSQITTNLSKCQKKSQTQTLPQVTFDFFAAYKLFQSMKSLQQLPKQHPPNPHSTPSLQTPLAEWLPFRPEELWPVAELAVSHQLLQAKVSCGHRKCRTQKGTSLGKISKLGLVSPKSESQLLKVAQRNEPSGRMRRCGGGPCWRIQWPVPKKGFI